MGVCVKNVWASGDKCPWYATALGCLPILKGHNYRWSLCVCVFKVDSPAPSPTLYVGQR